MNTLFLAFGYRIAMKICKDGVLESCETVKKFDDYIKNSRKFEIFCLSIYIVKKLNVQNVSRVGTGNLYMETVY